MPLPPSNTSRKLLSHTYLWGCSGLLALVISDAIVGLFNCGLSPVKPILFTLFAVFVMTGLALLHQPRFAPASLLVLLLPLIRLIDSTVLKRATISSVGQVEMDMFRMFIVLLAILALLATDDGLRIVTYSAVFAIFLTTGSEIFEMLGFAKFTSIPGRYSGFNGHPNFPPMLLCTMLGICFALQKNFHLNMLLIATSYVGVGLTYGRSGFMVLTAMSLIYILLHARQHLGFLIACVAIAIPLAGAGIAILESQTGSGLKKSKDTAGRMDAILNLDFDKLKSPERAKDLADGWEAVMAKPIFGHGTGMSGGRWVPHNEYVSIWLELGFPGLLLFVGKLGLLILRSLMTGGRAGFLIFAIVAFTPAGQGRLEMPHFNLAVSTAAILLWPHRYRIVLHDRRLPSPS